VVLVLDASAPAREVRFSRDDYLFVWIVEVLTVYDAPAGCRLTLKVAAGVHVSLLALGDRRPNELWLQEMPPPGNPDHREWIERPPGNWPVRASVYAAEMAKQAFSPLGLARPISG
jgi:hypothetical protein